MATGCPNNNCIALARWPVADPAEYVAPPGPSARRAGAAPVAAAAFEESFAVIASPTLLANEAVPYNRIALQVTALTEGRVLKAYRAQLEQAIKTIDEAMQKGVPSVEVLLKVPDDLTRPRRPGEKDTLAGALSVAEPERKLLKVKPGKADGKKAKTKTKTKTKTSTGKKRG